MRMARRRENRAAVLPRFVRGLAVLLLTLSLISVSMQRKALAQTSTPTVTLLYSLAPGSVPSGYLGGPLRTDLWYYVFRISGAPISGPIGGVNGQGVTLQPPPLSSWGRTCDPNVIYIGVVPSDPSGTYTLSLLLPSGPTISTTFSHPGTPVSSPPSLICPSATPTPSPTPAQSALSVIGFKADSTADMGRCYEVTLTLKNNTSSPQSGQVSISESGASYFTEIGGNLTPAATPSNDSRGDCGGSGLSQTVLVLPGDTQNVSFGVSHHWDWVPSPINGLTGMKLVASVLNSSISSVEPLVTQFLGGALSATTLAQKLLDLVRAVVVAQYQYQVPMTGALQGASVQSGVTLSQSTTVTVPADKQELFSLSLADSALTTLAALTGVGWEAALIGTGLNVGLSYMAWDPNPAYTQPVVPQTLHITQFDSLPPGPAYNCGQTVEQFLSDVLAAEAASTEAQAAEAAGDTTWYTNQLAAANGFMNAANAQDATITSCLQLLPPGSAPVGGISPDLLSALTQIGLPTDGLQEMVQAFMQAAPNVTPSPDAASTSLQQMLGSAQNAGATLQPAPSASAASGVTYAAGWNLVGGPPATMDTGALSSLFTLQAGDTSYESLPTNTPLGGGEGYWAYFASPTTVTLPAGVSGSLTSPLPSGQYVIAGNPFDGPATLQASKATTWAIMFNATTNSYSSWTRIDGGGSLTLPAGQGAWVFSPSAGTLTLTPGGASPSTGARR